MLNFPKGPSLNMRTAIWRPASPDCVLVYKCVWTLANKDHSEISALRGRAGPGGCRPGVC